MAGYKITKKDAYYTYEAPRTQRVQIMQTS